MKRVRVAAAKVAPVFMDRNATLAKAVDTIQDAARNDGEAILYAALDPAWIDKAKSIVDTAGHYVRPDVVTLHLNQAAQRPLVIDRGTLRNLKKPTDALRSREGNPHGAGRSRTYISLR